MISAESRAFAPELNHEPLIDSLPRALGLPYFRSLLRGQSDLGDISGLYTEWQLRAREKLTSLLLGSMSDLERPNPTIQIEFERDDALEDGTKFHEIRFVFSSEPGSDVPCHLLLPVGGAERPPVAICIQGHSTGMHISMGRASRPNDANAISGGDRDFVLQAIRRGWAGLAIEQRGFGEREPLPPFGRHGSDARCQHAAVSAFLLGRTLLGERCFDVSRVIDVLQGSFADRVDTGRFLSMGNSGGGTTTFYSACLDERITAAMPSASVCSYRQSIGRIHHCVDNYIPGIGQFFEMGDLAVLIAPRPLIVVTGADDDIFPLAGVREAFATIQEIYDIAGAPDNCRLVIGDGGHRFYAEPGWAGLDAVLNRD